MIRNTLGLFSLTTIILFSPLISQTTVAVLPLAGKGVSEVEASALTDRLTLELFRKGKFIVLEREKIEEILNEQDFQQTGCVSAKCAVEIGKNLGIEQIVFGSITKIGTTYSIQARLVDIETGVLVQVASYDSKGTVDDLLIVGMGIIAFTSCCSI